MNLLYDLQLSVLDSLNDGKFLMRTDSNINVASVLIRNLLLLDSSLNIYLIVPTVEKTTMTSSSQYLVNSSIDFDRVHFVYYDYYGNPFIDRMTFDSRSLKNSLDNIDVDIVYTNDPCKVLEYKTLLYYIKSKSIPVVCRNHWISGITDRKVPKSIDFALRQGEGALYCDWMTFNSKYAISLFVENMGEFFKSDFINSMIDKFDSMEMVDFEKVDRHRTLYKSSVFTILWANRLSYYTGWDDAFAALMTLWNNRQDFQVIVPDPGNKFSQDDLKYRFPFVKTIDKDLWTHEEYIKTCWESDVCIGNHKYRATWGGLAITEPMAACTVPIIPRRDAYTEMFYDDSKSYFNDEIDMIKVIEMYMDNETLLFEDKIRARRFCEENFSPKQFALKVHRKILNLCL